MTITADQAKTLLDNATDGPWRSMHDEWEDVDGNPCEDFYVLGGPDGILYTEDFDPDTHDPKANTALAAAAPDLARTVIDQAATIEALSTAHRFLSETYNTDIARLAAELPDNEMVYDLETGHPDGEATMNRVVGILHQAREADQ